jgi:hypothetical protein
MTKSVRTSYKDVYRAFRPIAIALRLEYVEGTPDFDKVGTVYMGWTKGGFYRPMEVTKDGGSRPVLKGVPPLKAADAVLLFNGISAVLPQLSKHGRRRADYKAG